MNKEQLESLPYPMFETNWYEKLILKSVLGVKDTKYLCIRVKRYSPFPFSGGLVRKISRSCCGLLDSVKGFPEIHGYDHYVSVEMRNIWIRKLLAYKPE